MDRQQALARTPLFLGLDNADLETLAARMRERDFEAGEQLCKAGEPSDKIWVITGGLVHWLVPTTEGAGDLALRLRKGDVVGAQDAITGEPRSATVVASIKTSTLELDGQDLVDLTQRFPQVLINLVSTQRARLSRASARSAESERGEEVALVAGPALQGAVNRIVSACRVASARPVTFLDRRLSFAGALTAADDLAARHPTVLIPGDLDPRNLDVLLDEVDRVVALVGSAAEVEQLAGVTAAERGRRLEAVLVGEEAISASQWWPPNAQRAIVRSCERQAEYPLADEDLAWLARHLTRTKLGVALGAGGAKGFAHVGALRVLEEAGYTIDYAGGSSIGGFVASHLALGHGAAAIDERFRAAFNPDAVSALFSTPFGGGGAGLEVLTQLLRDATEEKSFSDTVIPLIIMAVDLTDRAPAPLREGPLWEALLAALAVAGVFPPQERDGHRLVDGLALVPVPTASVVDDGADLVVSVNLMGAETLERWPSGPELEEPPAPKRRRGMLDTLLEVMDLSQLDTSTRHAALADVTITPKFAPSDWRDFNLAPLFEAAGRQAALEQLPVLQGLSRPVDLDEARRGEVLGSPA
jgi:NTE family protein